MAVFNMYFVCASVTLQVLHASRFLPVFLWLYVLFLCVENILSLRNCFGMLTVNIKRTSIVMSQFSILCVCAYTWKAPISFVVSVHMDHLSSYWMNFCENLYEGLL
jgi:hypothetical protein